jgi:hypothetical protein
MTPDSPTPPFPHGGQPPVTASSTVKVRRHFLPRWRFFTWVILAFNLIMLIWVISGASTGKSCKGLTGDALTNCQAGQVGTGIGVGLIILLWALGDIILGTIWLITKPRTRHCPACGSSVRRSVMQCQDCGFDFRQMVAASRTGWGRQGEDGTSRR